MDALRLVLIPCGVEHVRTALDARARFGNGCHPAGQDPGDWMTHATGRRAGRSPPARGDDLARTDIDVVPGG